MSEQYTVVSTVRAATGTEKARARDEAALGVYRELVRYMEPTEEEEPCLSSEPETRRRRRRG